MKNKKLIIVGAGAISHVAYEYFTHDSDYEIVGFSVEKEYLKSDKFLDLPVEPFEELEKKYSPKEYEVFVALGESLLNRVRTRLYLESKKKGYKIASYISSKAFVWHNVEIGENCFILEDNTIQTFSKIGNNVILWSGNHIGHSSVIKDNCFITSQVVISGFCQVDENTFIGVNSAIANNIKVAKDNFIAMGSIINKDTDENKIYKGNPAESAYISAKMFCGLEE